MANLTWDEFSSRCEKFGVAHGKVLKQVEVLLNEQVRGPAGICLLSKHLCHRIAINRARASSISKPTLSGRAQRNPV